MQIFKVKKEVAQIDHNIERPFESLDPHPPPRITDWHRQKDEKKKRQIDFL